MGRLQCDAGTCVSLCHSVQRLVKSYLEDNSPEAYLSVGADMRKIQLCFQIMRVSMNHCAGSVCVNHLTLAYNT